MLSRRDRCRVRSGTVLVAFAGHLRTAQDWLPQTRLPLRTRLPLGSRLPLIARTCRGCGIWPCEKGTYRWTGQCTYTTHIASRELASGRFDWMASRLAVGETYASRIQTSVCTNWLNNSTTSPRIVPPSPILRCSPLSHSPSCSDWDTRTSTPALAHRHHRRHFVAISFMRPF